MTRLESVIVQPEWYSRMKPLLEQAVVDTKGDRTFRANARTTLRTLRLHARHLEEGKWDQVVFTRQQADFLASLAEVLGMEDAQKKFLARTVRS